MTRRRHFDDPHTPFILAQPTQVTLRKNPDFGMPFQEWLRYLKLRFETREWRSSLDDGSHKVRQYGRHYRICVNSKLPSPGAVPELLSDKFSFSGPSVRGWQHTKRCRGQISVLYSHGYVHSSYGQSGYGQPPYRGVHRTRVRR